MPIVLQVNFTPSAEQSRESDQAKRSRARVTASLAHLHWKIWIHNEDSRGGIYLFSDRASAEAWGEGVLRTRLTRAGATNVSIRYFEIDEETSAITRAPVFVGEPA